LNRIKISKTGNNTKSVIFSYLIDNFIFQLLQESIENKSKAFRITAIMVKEMPQAFQHKNIDIILNDLNKEMMLIKNFEENILISYIEGLTQINELLNISESTYTLNAFHKVQFLIKSEFNKLNKLNFDFLSKYLYFMSKFDSSLIEKYKRNINDYLDFLTKELKTHITKRNNYINFGPLASVFIISKKLKLDQTTKISLFEHIVKLISPKLLQEHLLQHSIYLKEFLVQDINVYNKFQGEFTYNLNRSYNKSDRIFKLIGYLTNSCFYIDANMQTEHLKNEILNMMNSQSSSIELYPLLFEVYTYGCQNYLYKEYKEEIYFLLLNNYNKNFIRRLNSSMVATKLWLNLNQIVLYEDDKNYKQLKEKIDDLNNAFLSFTVFSANFIGKVLNLAEDGYYFNNQGLTNVLKTLIFVELKNQASKKINNYCDSLIQFLYSVIVQKYWNVEFEGK